MFSLPRLAPRDVECYALWYTSSSPPSPQTVNDHDDQMSPQTQRQSRIQNVAHRSPLAHLRSDEESIRIYKRNITDFGAAWLKPPGISKSLQQLRDEEREMKEHQEALRREQLAQELAEAGSGLEMDGSQQGEEGMEELPDLDAEIPEADNSAFDSNEEEDLDEEDSGPDNQTPGLPTLNDLSIPDDLYRRETLFHDRLLRDDDSSIIDEKELTGMLLEEDLVTDRSDAEWINGTMGMNQDMDLDDEIPEGESYEHTDTEEVSSSEDGNESLPL